MPRNILIKPIRITPDTSPNDILSNEIGVSNGVYNQFGLLYKNNSNKVCVLNNIDYYTIIVEAIEGGLISAGYTSGGIIIPGNNYGNNIKTNAMITKIYSVSETLDNSPNSCSFQVLRKVGTTSYPVALITATQNITVNTFTQGSNTVLDEGANYIYLYINNSVSAARLVVTLEVARY